MNLDFDETQLMLRTQARDFISKKCPMALVRELALTEKGYSEEVWHAMAELGWMSIPFPERYGGAGMSFFEVLLLLEEMGRAALPSPFLSTMLCGLTISQFGTEKQKEDSLPGIVSGELIFALASTEPSAGLEPSGITLKATKGGGTKYGLTGTKLFCSDAHIADRLLVVCRTAPATGKEPSHGITLFITPAKSPAVICYPQDTIGFDHLSQIEFVNLVVDDSDMLGELDKGWPIVQKLLNWGAMGKCAEMIGASDRALEMSLEYAKERVQYGRHIGSFQKQQHRLADMWIALEGSRNFFYEAGWSLSSGSDDPMYVSVAKAMVSEMAEELVDQATLLHGAIGLSWDYDLGFLLRRIRAASVMFGHPRYHYAIIARELEEQTA